MIYWIMYAMMELGYIGLTCLAPTLKQKLIGLLLCIVNGLIFYK